MNDSNEGQLAIHAGPTRSIEAVQASKSGNPGEPLDPTTLVAQRKRRHFVKLIALMSLGAIAIIIYVLRPALVRSYEGIAVALCVAACGLFLVRRFIRVLAEEDKLQDQELDANQATVSSSQPNPAGLPTNPAEPPPEAGENIECQKP